MPKKSAGTLDLEAFLTQLEGEGDLNAVVTALQDPRAYVATFSKDASTTKDVSAAITLASSKLFCCYRKAQWVDERVYRVCDPQQKLALLFSFYFERMLIVFNRLNREQQFELMQHHGKFVSFLHSLNKQEANGTLDRRLCPQSIERLIRLLDKPQQRIVTSLTRSKRKAEAGSPAAVGSGGGGKAAMASTTYTAHIKASVSGGAGHAGSVVPIAKRVDSEDAANGRLDIAVAKPVYRRIRCIRSQQRPAAQQSGNKALALQIQPQASIVRQPAAPETPRSSTTVSAAVESLLSMQARASAQAQVSAPTANQVSAVHPSMAAPPAPPAHHIPMTILHHGNMHTITLQAPSGITIEPGPGGSFVSRAAGYLSSTRAYVWQMITPERPIIDTRDAFGRIIKVSSMPTFQMPLESRDDACYTVVVPVAPVIMQQPMHHPLQGQPNLFGMQQAQLAQQVRQAAANFTLAPQQQGPAVAGVYLNVR